MTKSGLLRVIRFLGKIKKKGDVTLDELKKLAEAIDDREARELVVSIAESGGSEDKLADVAEKLVSMASGDEELSEVLGLAFDALS